jgi:hypothetical protein
MSHRTTQTYNCIDFDHEEPEAIVIINQMMFSNINDIRSRGTNVDVYFSSMEPSIRIRMATWQQKMQRKRTRDTQIY